MNKMLNTDAITNDLEESAFFRQRKSEPALPVPPYGRYPQYAPYYPYPLSNA